MTRSNKTLYCNVFCFTFDFGVDFGCDGSDDDGSGDDGSDIGSEDEMDDGGSGDDGGAVIPNNISSTAVLIIVFIDCVSSLSSFDAVLLLRDLFLPPSDKKMSLLRSPSSGGSVTGRRNTLANRRLGELGGIGVPSLLLL